MGKNPLRALPSQGILARKQVRRNRSDRTMFIITYTSDHNHPMPTHKNSLASNTLQKIVTANDSNKPYSSPPVSLVASLFPATENMESKEEKEGTMEEDDDEFGFVSDDFFMGLEEVVGSIGGNGCSDEFPTSLLFTPIFAGGD
ncbi:hypothetical protein LguiA_016859 [Lonicera macranthoides]